MGTEAARKASRAYHAKREADGLKKVTLWLGPKAREKLDALKIGAGSKDKAAELAIMAYGQKQQATVKMGEEPLEGTPSTAKVSVPFAGNLTRKPMQKKGK